MWACVGPVGSLDLHAGSGFPRKGARTGVSRPRQKALPCCFLCFLPPRHFLRVGNPAAVPAGRVRTPGCLGSRPREGPGGAPREGAPRTGAGVFLERGRSGNGGGSRRAGGGGSGGNGRGGRGRAEEGRPHPPASPTPGPAELIISGVLQTNINNPVTEGIWENRIKRTLCKPAGLPTRHSQRNPGGQKKTH